MTMHLTNEQKGIVAAASNGDSFKIKAFAGTGKTTTLVAISQALQGKGLYIAYNKAIQQEAKNKFSENVTVITAHGLAYAFLKNSVKGRVKTLSNYEFKQTCLQNNIALASEEFYISALKLLRAFCNSSKKVIDISLIKTINDDGTLSNEINALKVIEAVRSYWYLLNNQAITIEHDFYLKMFQLMNVDLSKYFNFILFDEVQDASPVMLDIVKKQPCQKVYVGDSYQQIYAWRGAVNALKNIKLPEYCLSESFRFGDEICHYANKILSLKKESVQLVSHGAVTFITEDSPKSYTALCRTNLGLLDTLIKHSDKKLYVIGGIEDILSLLYSGIDLCYGNKVNHPKLSAYSNWHDLKLHNETKDDGDLTLLIDLIESYQDDLRYLIQKIEALQIVENESDAEVILSTIHKSKGKEWDNVRIMDDLSILYHDKPMIFLINNLWDEFNLLYVAVTRAKKKLIVSGQIKNFFKKIDEHLVSKPSKAGDATIKEAKAKQIVEATNNLSHYKINSKLKKMGLSHEKITELNVIDEEQEILKAKSLIAKKYPIIKAKNEYERKQKLTKHLVGKGFSFVHIKSAIYDYLEKY